MNKKYSNIDEWIILDIFDKWWKGDKITNLDKFSYYDSKYKIYESSLIIPRTKANNSSFESAYYNELIDKNQIKLS